MRTRRLPSFLSNTLVCLGLLIVCVTAQAFELSDLRQQLQQAPVVRGRFVQQKLQKLSITDKLAHLNICYIIYLYYV